MDHTHSQRSGGFIQPELLAASLPSPLKEHFLSGRYRDFEQLTQDSSDYQIELCRDYIHRVLARAYHKAGSQCCANLSLRHLGQAPLKSSPKRDPDSVIFYNLRHLDRKLTLPIEPTELPDREGAYPGPYLAAPEKEIDAWRTRLKPYSRKVGLLWAPGLTLQALTPFLNTRNTQFFGLQQGPDQTQALWPPADLPFVDLSQYLEDWACVAGLLQNLDLLISVDHPTAHLAGAMGRPLRILNANIGDYGPNTKIWTARSSRARRRNPPLENGLHDSHAPPKSPTRSRGPQ